MTLQPINEYLDELDEVCRRADVTDWVAENVGWYVLGYYAGLSPCDTLLAWINETPPYVRPMPREVEVNDA